MRGRRAGLGFIFVTLFLDVFGLGIVVPIMPRLIGSFQPDAASASRMYGWFVAAYAAMQFLFSPVVGSLSDRFGRRPLLLASNLGQGLDYLVLAFAPSLPWLFAARMAAGVTGASISTAAAYIADVSPPEKRAQNFGIIGAAFGLGFIAGPAVGGLLGSHDPSLPFFVAASLCLANFLFGLLILPESLPHERRRPFDWRHAHAFGSLATLRRYPAVMGIIVAGLLSSLAQRGMESTWVLYTAGRYGWDIRTTGVSLALVGLSAAVVQGGLVRRLIPRLGEPRALLTGLALTTIAFVLYGLSSEGWMLYASLPLGALGGISGPAAQGMMSKAVGSDEQGMLQGAVTSLQSLTQVVAPLYATHLFAAFGHKESVPYLPGAPFFAGAMLVAVALLISLRTLATSPRPAASAGTAP